MSRSSLPTRNPTNPRWVLSLILAVAAVLTTASPVRGEDAGTTPTVGEESLSNSIFNATEEPAAVPIYYCKGICGGDEGRFADPGLVVEYQWNLKVPVCSGSSCQSASCWFLSERLTTLDVDEFQCQKHQKELQYTAGCTCTKRSEDDDFGMGHDDVDLDDTLNPPVRWILIVVAIVVVCGILIGLRMASRHDDSLPPTTAKDVNNDEESYMPEKEEGSGPNESAMPENEEDSGPNESTSN